MPDRSYRRLGAPTLADGAAPVSRPGSGGRRVQRESMPPRSRPSLARRLARRLDPRGRSRGQSLVELALILPVLMLILVAAGDLARVFSTQVSLDSAARAGALEAAVHPTSYQAGAACDANVNRVMCAVLTES